MMYFIFFRSTCLAVTTYPLGIKENAVAVGNKDGTIDILKGNSLNHVRTLRGIEVGTSSPITALRFLCGPNCVAHLYSGNRAGELVKWDLSYNQNTSSSSSSSSISATTTNNTSSNSLPSSLIH